LRHRATQALGRIGVNGTPASKVAIKALTAAIHDPDPRIRLAAAFGLSQMSQTQFSELIPLLKDPDVEVRRYALMTMGNRARHAQAIIDDILASMRHADARVRRAAAVAVTADDLGQDRVAMALLSLLADPDAEVRAQAAINLALVDANEAIWI